MEISNSNPIQWWLVDQASFNNKIEVGVEHKNYFQPFNAEDLIRDQFADDAFTAFRLVIYDCDDEELQTLFYDEIEAGIFELNFHPEDHDITDEIVHMKRFEISHDDFTEYPALNKDWTSVAYGNGVWVAVGQTAGAANQVMTSPDAENWTLQTASANKNWRSVTFGLGIFVAVATDAVMTSPDGVTWTNQTAATADLWESVTFGNGQFVAVAAGGVGGQIMTSPDGINWTEQTSPNDFNWMSVAYGDGLFVAVGNPGTPGGQKVITSSDGITWIERVEADSTFNWRYVVYGNGRWVAVGGETGSPSSQGVVMYSDDAITWELAEDLPAMPTLFNVMYGNGYFIATVQDVDTNQIVLSVNGITWQLLANPVENNWAEGAFGDDKFVVVGFTSFSTTTDRVMVLTTEEEEIAYSDGISIKESHAKTRLISYSNDLEYDGLDYTDDQFFSVRIRSKFYDPEEVEENESEDFSDGTTEKLSSSVKEGKVLETFDMPPYMHKKLRRILNHNSIYIENQAWVKEGNYEHQKINDRYAFFDGRVVLTLKNEGFVTNIL